MVVWSNPVEVDACNEFREVVWHVESSDASKL